MTDHEFGGEWTEKKLACLRKYLTKYRTIFARNERARHLRTWYVDAFAGTGSRTSYGTGASELPLFEDVYQDEGTRSYGQGSAIIALELESPFDKFLFIEKNKQHVAELRERIRRDFPKLLEHCQFEIGDANKVLQRWCARRDWRKERAVVFLDPYGMQVEWPTVELLAKTGAVDLWYLFPMVARLLKVDGKIDKRWEKRLTLLFGTPTWRAHFYQVRTDQGLFGNQEVTERDASDKNVQEFIQQRLKTCFEGVSEETLALKNSKGSTLFLLCFAAANKKGAPTALKIAKSILKG
jgi:three-Cys-motif partner protein